MRTPTNSIAFALPVALASALAIATVGRAAAQTPLQTGNQRTLERTITVTANGSSVATPDIAHVSTGVLVEAATARQAMTADAAAMTKIVAGLKAAGIDAKDIQTTGINLNPRYSAPKDGHPGSITGYSAQNMVRLTVRDLTKLGEILDAAVTLGATQMNGITFDVKDAETLRDAARKAAIVNARRRAELYSAAAGVTLGDVITIDEGGGSQPFNRGFSPGAMRSAAAVPVEAGEIDLNSTVTVTWQLK